MTEKVEVYKLAVEMADRVSARRMLANSFFLTVHTALVGVITFAYDKVAASHQLLLVTTCAMGVVLGLAWFLVLRSYRRLNRAKYVVINELEKDLSVQYFTNEWEALKRTTAGDHELKGIRNWWLKVRDRYTDLTVVESVVPLLFTVVYIVVAVASGSGMLK